VLSQIKRVIRTNYSNPPTHGGAWSRRCCPPELLRQMWEDELAEMRERIRAMRTGLVDKLKAGAWRRTFPSSPSSAACSPTPG
jgi:aromatic-amino-acid transaminase